MSVARAAVDRGEDVLDPLRRALGRTARSPWWDEAPLRWSGSGP